MKLHANARSSPKGRLLMCRRVIEEEWSLKAAAEAAGCSERTARKWLRRYRSEGELGLLDRSSAPRRVANRTAPERVEAIASLRRLRFTGPQIAEVLDIASSTVSAVLKRIGLGKLSRLEPPEPPNRYEKRRPGELVHIDVKKLGRMQRAGWRPWGSHAARPMTRRYQAHQGHGWECCHVAVDDATRLAFAEVLDDDRAHNAVAFLKHAVAFFRAHGIRVERLMTDNAMTYRSLLFADACKRLGLKHSRTRPYRPRTNGKAERFIRTLLAEWAYAALYRSSLDRAAALPGWLERYNTSRRHGALGHRPPLARLRELQGNNVAGSYI